MFWQRSIQTCVFIINNDNTKAIHMWDSVPFKETQSITPFFFLATFWDSLITIFQIICSTAIKLLCWFVKVLGVSCLPESLHPWSANSKISVFGTETRSVLICDHVSGNPSLLVLFLLQCVYCFQIVFWCFSLDGEFDCCWSAGNTLEERKLGKVTFTWVW